MNHGFALLLSAIGAVAFTGCASAGLEEGDAIDTSEEELTTSACQPPSTLRCVTINGKLSCTCVAPPPQPFYDTSTACTVGGVTMHCCPTGSAMVGVRLDQNTFKCAPMSNATGTISLDAGTVRNGMHVCPFGSVMVGLHRDLNMLACQQRPAGSITSERVDTATTDSFPMHVCQNPVATEAMSGIHADLNRLSCSSNANLTH